LLLSYRLRLISVALLIGSFAAIRSVIASCSVIATSGTPSRPAEVAAGISTALLAPLVGMLFMTPGYPTH